MNEFIMEMNTPTPPGDRKFLLFDYKCLLYKNNANVEDFFSSFGCCWFPSMD